jgi:hypothetical protein
MAALRQHWLAAASAVLVAAALSAAIATHGGIAPAAAVTPATAVNALETANKGPILNSYEFGGYLDFVGIAPFVDGRTELYGEAFMLRYNRAVTLEDLPDFLRLLDQYRIERTLLTPNTPAVALLDRLPDWRRVYTDGVAIVHARRVPPAN